MGHPKPGPPSAVSLPVGVPPHPGPSPAEEQKYLMLRGDTSEETEIEISICQTDSGFYVAGVRRPELVSLPTLREWKWKMETLEKHRSANGKKFFAFPKSSLRTEDNVIAVLLENMGLNEDYDANDDYKRQRGLIEVRLIGSSSTITWYIKGNTAGEDVVDFVRGQVNNGGLYGELHGWYLAGYLDQSWHTVELPYRVNEAGIQWYRISFPLDISNNHDIPIGVRIIDKEFYRYRALIFVNGRMMEHYINYFGPQNLFYVPASILKNYQQNGIAIAVWNEDSTNGGLGEVILEKYGSYRGGVHVENVYSPTYQEFELCKFCQFHNCKVPGLNCHHCLQCNCDCSKCNFTDGYFYLRCGCNKRKSSSTGIFCSPLFLVSE
eukprot:jgi/Galph1/3454/GphlegSOOS_G2115.1